MATLIVPDWLVISAGEHPHRGFGLRVVDDRVDVVGPGEELRANFPNDEVVEAAGRVALPGFVNTHTHLYGVLAHGIPTEAAPAGFESFLVDYWWPYVEDRLDQDHIAAATEWMCVEMLASGTTGFFDILEAPAAIPGALAVQREVVERRGLRATLTFEATERKGEANGLLGLAENEGFVLDCLKTDGLVSGAMSFHTTFTCSEAFIREAFSKAAELDVLCHAHVNEGNHEPEWNLRRHGMRTVEWYEQLGVLSNRFLASQVVQVSEQEIRLLAERGVGCSHMPLSNAEVGGGIAPVPELQASGVRVGLGSDGYLNDMYEVMRGAVLFHKARLADPRVMPASLVLQMATEGGASLLGWDEVGRLSPGSAADLQLVRSDWPTPVTATNLYDQLVLWRNHSHVTDVMVAGRWRVRHGEVLDADVEAIRQRATREATRLWEQAR